MIWGERVVVGMAGAGLQGPNWFSALKNPVAENIYGKRILPWTGY